MDKTPKQLLSFQVYQILKDDIVTCSLDPGQVIAQADLTEKYGFGVTPVREALRQLAQEGFVQPVPRLGYIVSPITEQDVQEIFEMRGMLECGAVRLAVERGQPERLEAIQKSSDFTYIYHDRESYTRFLQLNAEFHLSIASVTGNTRLAASVSRVLDELNRVFHLGLDLRDSAEEMREDHLAIASALAARNGDLAEELVQKEIVHSRERVMEALKSHPSSPARWIHAGLKKAKSDTN